MDVRCCCRPEKMLGSLPVMDAVRVGDLVRFVVMKPAMRMADFHWRAAALPTANDIRHVQMEVLDWSDPKTRDAGVAIKADGVDIETLRRIPGFIEAKS